MIAPPNAQITLHATADRKALARRSRPRRPAVVMEVPETFDGERAWVGGFGGR